MDNFALFIIPPELGSLKSDSRPFIVLSADASVGYSL